jgi:hypothetical protein
MTIANLKKLCPLHAAGLVFACTLLSAAAPTPPAAPAATPAPAAADVSAFKDKLRLFTDGKGHYVTISIGTWKDADTEHLGASVFYGDGKKLYRVRAPGMGFNGDAKEANIHFWEPRAKIGNDHELAVTKNVMAVHCPGRVAELKIVPEKDARPLLDKAEFFEALWQFGAYALARDSKGVYYYVDRQREPAGVMNFRVWSGQRGDLKPLKMTNVVSDSMGDIFQTKGGDLRLVLDKGKASWQAGGQPVELTIVPIEDNAELIYTDLGAYAGQRLGTPCDDL